MHIEAEVIICMQRFKYLRHWKAFSYYLFWNNLVAEILGHPLLNMPCDGMPIRYLFDEPYHIMVLT